MQKGAQSFLQQLIGAVEELEATMDNDDVTCAVSIIHRRRVAYWRPQEDAVGTDPK